MLTYRKIPSNFKTENNIGLGNQMFFMASTMGIAIKNNLSYGWEPFYPDVFPNQAPKLISDKRLCIIPWGYHNISPGDNQALYGYMQSEKYFKHCRDKVLWLFEMNKQSDIELPDDAVCIHVRRGDYVTGSHHYNLGPDYYFKAMDMIKGTYFVFSDDIPYCKELFGDRVNYIQGNVFEDLYLMGKCKRFVIANSSLSWWAAWLTGGETIAPLNWFAGANLKLDTKDLYAEGWIVI